MSQYILLTGGAGYIGSHTVLQLLLSGYRIVVIDNLDNSSAVAIKRVQELAGRHGHNLEFQQVFSSFFFLLVEHIIKFVLRRFVPLLM